MILLDVLTTHALCVLLGAPLLHDVGYTCMFSILFVAVGGRPCPLLFLPRGRRRNGGDGPEVRLTDCSSSSIVSTTFIFGIASWLGTVTAPLDWQTSWQYWPVPSIVLLLLAAFIMKFVNLWK